LNGKNKGNPLKTEPQTAFTIMSNCAVKLKYTYQPTVVPSGQPIPVIGIAEVENCSVNLPTMCYIYYGGPSPYIKVYAGWPGTNPIIMGIKFMACEQTPFNAPPGWFVSSLSLFSAIEFPIPGVYIVGFMSGYALPSSSIHFGPIIIPMGSFIVPQDISPPIAVIVSPLASTPGIPIPPPPSNGVKIIDAYISTTAYAGLPVKWRVKGEVVGQAWENPGVGIVYGSGPGNYIEVICPNRAPTKVSIYGEYNYILQGLQQPGTIIDSGDCYVVFPTPGKYLVELYGGVQLFTGPRLAIGAIDISDGRLFWVDVKEVPAWFFSLNITDPSNVGYYIETSIPNTPPIIGSKSQLVTLIVPPGTPNVSVQASIMATQPQALAVAGVESQAASAIESNCIIGVSGGQNIVILSFNKETNTIEVAPETLEIGPVLDYMVYCCPSYTVRMKVDDCYASRGSCIYPTTPFYSSDCCCLLPGVSPPPTTTSTTTSPTTTSPAPTTITPSPTTTTTSPPITTTPLPPPTTVTTVTTHSPPPSLPIPTSPPIPIPIPPTPSSYWTLYVKVNNPYAPGFVQYKIADNYGHSMEGSVGVTSFFADYPSDVTSVTLTAELTSKPPGWFCSIMPSSVTVNAPSGGVGTVTQEFNITCAPPHLERWPTPAAGTVSGAGQIIILPNGVVAMVQQMSPEVSETATKLQQQQEVEGVLIAAGLLALAVDVLLLSSRRERKRPNVNNKWESLTSSRQEKLKN